jgi:hypothetical protein
MMQLIRGPSFRVFAWRVISLHTLTYFLLGLAAFYILNYRDAYVTTELRYLMGPTSSAWVAAGPGLQPVRGILFALVLLMSLAGFLAASGHPG